MKNKYLYFAIIPLTISLLVSFNHDETKVNSTYKVEETQISKIEVDTSNMKTEYLVGESFSYEGGKLNIYDNNDNVTTVDLTYEMFEDYPNLSSPKEDYVVYVSYLNKYTSFTIDVLDTYKMTPQINVYVITEAKINNKDHEDKVILKNKDNIEYSSSLSYSIEVEVIPSNVNYSVTYYTNNKTNEYSSEPLYNGDCLVSVTTVEDDTFREYTKDITYYLSITPEFSFTYGDKRTPLTNGMEFYVDYVPSFYTSSNYVDCAFETYFSINDGAIKLDSLPNEVGTYAINCKSTNESHKYSDIGQFRWFKIIEGTPGPTYYDSVSINFVNNENINAAYTSSKVYEKNKEVVLDSTSDIPWVISYGAKTTDASSFHIGNCLASDYGYTSEYQTLIDSSITMETDTTSDNYKIAEALGRVGSNVVISAIYSKEYISSINDIHLYWSGCEAGGFIRMLYNLEGSDTWTLLKTDEGEGAVSVSNEGSGVAKSFNRYAYDNYLTFASELKGKNARIAFTYEIYNTASKYYYLTLGGIRINTVSSCYNFANYVASNAEEYERLVNLNNGHLKAELEVCLSLLTDDDINSLKNMKIYTFSSSYDNYYDYLSFLASKCGIEGYSDPLLGNTNAPPLITYLSSFEQLNDISTNSIKPSNIIVRINENIDVIDINNNVINDLDSIYQALTNLGILLIVDISGEYASYSTNLKTYLKSHSDIIDIAILSDNETSLYEVRAAGYYRGIYYVNSLDKITDAVQVSNRAKAQTIMIDSALATYDIVKNYIYMFKSVFLMSDSNKELIDQYKSICLPVNGLVTSSYLEAFSFYASLDKNCLFSCVANIAHRGASGYHENSISGSLEAINQGATHLELDIFSTLDDELVLSHDNSIERTTNGTGNIEEMTLEEIKNYQLDEFDYLEDIPTLAELLDSINDSEVILVLEIKGNKYGLGEKITNVLKEYEMDKRTVCISFNIDFLGSVKSYDNEIPLLWLNAPNQENYYTKLDSVLDYNVGFDISIEKATSSYTLFLKERGFYVGTWTYASISEMKSALSNGLYALTNDDCSLLSIYVFTYEVIELLEDNKASIKITTINNVENIIEGDVIYSIDDDGATFYLISVSYNDYIINLCYYVNQGSNQ
ncbi:MAG: glycerophosphodiester phosphodiesterase [Bacilli bacterium]